MKSHPCTLARRSSATRGQALAETAVVIVMLVLLVAGVTEVGWAFARANMITHAARDGARYAATLDSSFRDAVTGCFTSTDDVQTHVETALDAIGFTADSVSVDQDCDGSIPIITVTVTGTLDMLFGFMGQGGIAVDRSITFEDEGRQSGNCC